MSAWESGAKTNCPKDPPALMNPEAKERFSGAMRFAAAPIRIEKLPAPAPAAVSTPRKKTSPSAEDMKGVATSPIARSRPPAIITRTGPTRSAIAPKTGCAAPHTNCATARVKLTVTMPSPVEVLRGETKSPSDWRIPIVTARIAAPAMARDQVGRVECMRARLAFPRRGRPR